MVQPVTLVTWNLYTYSELSATFRSRARGRRGTDGQTDRQTGHNALCFPL